MNTEVIRWLEQDGLKFLKEVGIENGQTVLDFGCGEGHYSITVSGIAEKVYAMDKDKGVLDTLKETSMLYGIKNIELLNEDTKIPLNDTTIDVVLCYDVLHYGDTTKRKEIFTEISRVLTEEGLFSVYPKHHRKDYPLMELAEVSLEKIVEEIEQAGFVLRQKFLKTLLHDESLAEGYIFNFGKS